MACFSHLCNDSSRYCGRVSCHHLDTRTGIAVVGTLRTVTPVVWPAWHLWRLGYGILGGEKWWWGQATALSRSPCAIAIARRILAIIERALRRRRRRKFLMWRPGPNPQSSLSKLFKRSVHQTHECLLRDRGRSQGLPKNALKRAYRNEKK